MKVKVAGSRIVIGSPEKVYCECASMCVRLPCRHSHVSSCTCVKQHNLLNPYMLHKTTTTKKKRWRKILHLDEIAPRCLVQWHHAKWEKIPGCIAVVIFSSNRTGYHPRSQQCWRVCAPFRTDLNKTWKLTQSLLRCMNINVTSDSVEW